MRPFFLLLASAPTLFVLAACGTSSTPTGSGGASSTSTATTTGAGGAGSGTGGTTSSGTGGATSSGTGGMTSSGTGGTMSSGTGGAGGATGIMSCAEIGADDCFSNLDCIAADRCENQGGAALEVPCCVPGMRGTGVLGDPCAIDDDCATSLCVETPGGYLCSGECTKPADCIPALPACTKIPAILGKGAFCLPP